jgi:hypothetical protein
MYAECPHCKVQIEVVEVNCAVFRCGIFKDTGEQVPPHASKEECDLLTKEGRVWGCCKPFKYLNGKGVVCGYI